MGEAIQPQPGPQTKFLESPADIVIYGGAGGSGKSFALLLEPLRHIANKYFSAVIFRRTSPQITNPGGLWDESSKLYGPMRADPKISLLSWKFTTGMTVKFAHMEHEKNKYDWQGSQMPLICCEESQKIKMADLSLKPIKEIIPGDIVMTLQGPRKVLIVGGRRLEECVTLKFGNFEQIHSRTHKILTPMGWISYDECIVDAFPQPLIFLSKLFDFFGKFVKSFANKYQALLTPLCNRFLDHGRVSEFYLKFLDLRHVRLWETFVCRVAQGLESYFESFQCERLKREQQTLIHLEAIRFLQSQPSMARSSYFAAILGEFFGAPIWLRLSNLINYYWFLLRQRDEQLNLKAKNIQDGVQRQVDVEQQSQKGFSLGDQGKAQKHSPRRLRYVHPYRAEALTAEALWEIVPCQITPCGKKWVIDLTIEGASHYITESGLANKNCFDELTHFSASQFFYMLSRNRSMSGISGYVRATCNPDPDSFVAKLIDWWIGEDGFPIPERSGVLRYFIRINDELIWADNKEELESKYPKSKPKSLTFISAKVTDNQILLEKDPQYLANLEALPYVERMRLKEGNWKVRPAAGSYFKKSYFQIIKPDQLPARRTIVRYWDRAGTEKKEGNSPDFTAGVKVSRDAAGVFYVEHVERFQEDASNVPKRIEAMAGQDGRNTIIGLEQEPGASGKFEAQFYVKQLVGYVTKVLTPTTNKTSRAAPVSSQAEAGNFKIVEGHWNNTFLSELESFPISKNDDQVDALSGAFQILVDNVVGSFDQTYAQAQVEAPIDFRPIEW